jgi:hypothetical protein
MNTNPLFSTALRDFDAIFAREQAELRARSQAAAKPLSDDPRPSRIELVAVVAMYYGRSQATAEGWLAAEFGEQ